MIPDHERHRKLINKENKMRWCDLRKWPGGETSKDSEEVTVKLLHLSDTRASSHTKTCWPELDLFQNIIRAVKMESSEGGWKQCKLRSKARQVLDNASFDFMLKVVGSHGQVPSLENNMIWYFSCFGTRHNGPDKTRETATGGV